MVDHSVFRGSGPHTVAAPAGPLDSPMPQTHTAMLKPGAAPASPATAAGRVTAVDPDNNLYAIRKPIATTGSPVPAPAVSAGGVSSAAEEQAPQGRRHRHHK